MEHQVKLQKNFEVTTERIALGVGFVDFTDPVTEEPVIRYMYRFGRYHDLQIELWDGMEPEDPDEYHELAKQAAIEHLRQEYAQHSFFEEKEYEGMYDSIYIDRLGWMLGTIDAEKFVKEVLKK